MRLLINLIENSIRYNLETDGIIIIKGMKKNHAILLEILNSGISIPEKDLGLIFEQFIGQKSPGLPPMGDQALD